MKDIFHLIYEYSIKEQSRSHLNYFGKQREGATVQMIEDNIQMHFSFSNLISIDKNFF